jgi:hypothetical protein
MPLQPVAYLLAGLALLLAGRRLFWLFVAVIGFIAAARLVEEFIGPSQNTTTMVVALVAGLLGGVLAIAAQKLAIRVAGFLAGAFYLTAGLEALGMQVPGKPWLSLLIGGIIGAILLGVIFNWALIAFSSVAGAHLIVHPFGMRPEAAGALFIVLALFGIYMQARPRTAPRT